MPCKSARTYIYGASLMVILPAVVRPYGYAAAHAYAAYRDRLFLTYAIDSWWFGRAHTIFPEDVATGTVSTKNFSIAQVCQDSAFFQSV